MPGPSSAVTGSSFDERAATSLRFVQGLLAETADENRRLRGEFDVQTTENVRLTRTVDLLSIEILRLEQTRAFLTARRDAAELQVEVLKASTSWRVTAPLRALSRRFSRSSGPA